MIRNSCGCSPQGPGPECRDGREIYTAASRAFQELFSGDVMTAHDERWALYALTRLAYIDHLNGWQEGDVKIQRRAGFGMVFTRLNGQWVFQFGTKEDALLIDWLRNRGYYRYVQVKSYRPGDQLLGYYRMYEKDGQRTRKGERFPVQEQALPDVPPLFPRGMATPPEREIFARTPSSSLVDLKTQVAIRVAFLVARFTRPLTLSDRLLVQRQISRLLQDQGRVVVPSDEWTIQEIIDEAIQQKERLNGLLERSTRPLQE